MSGEAIAIITILAPIAVGAIAWAVRLARQVTALESRPPDPPIPAQSCVHTQTQLERCETKVGHVLATLEEWEKWRWTANEQALRETAEAVRELIKALGRLDG